MRDRTSEEVTAARGGGLLSRIRSIALHPATVRIGGLAVGLAVLGVIGRYSATPASALTLAAPNASTTASAAWPTAPPAPAAIAAGEYAARAITVADAGALIADASTSPSPSVGGDDIVDLNTANEEELKKLPGIGARRARAILDLRARLGGFRRVEDLTRVRGVGRAALKRLRPLVRVGSANAVSAPNPPRPP